MDDQLTDHELTILRLVVTNEQSILTHRDPVHHATRIAEPGTIYDKLVKQQHSLRRGDSL